MKQIMFSLLAVILAGCGLFCIEYDPHDPQLIIEGTALLVLAVIYVIEGRKEAQTPQDTTA
ncbi:hypothetical protein ACVA51_10635 [Pseudomonas luteola]